MLRKGTLRGEPWNLWVAEFTDLKHHSFPADVVNYLQSAVHSVDHRILI